MSVKINSLSEKEIRDIGDAFADFQYAESEFGKGFLLMKFRFFQFYFSEVESVYKNRKYGYNIKSQLLKLFVIFPAASALAAWICTLF